MLAMVTQVYKVGIWKPAARWSGIQGQSGYKERSCFRNVYPKAKQPNKLQYCFTPLSKGEEQAMPSLKANNGPTFSPRRLRK